MALDCDGYKDFLKGKKLPETFGVASGVPGRFCLFYRMPVGEFHHRTEKNPETGEKVEFRYNNKQQVIFGIHPKTGNFYKWCGSPQSIAEAPQWILDLMKVESKEPVTEVIDDDFTEIIEAVEALKQIPPTDDYEDWVRVGMALKSVSESLYEDWVNWSLKAENTCSEETYRVKWDSFNSQGVTLGTLKYLAQDDESELDEIKKRLIAEYIWLEHENKFIDIVTQNYVCKEALRTSYCRYEYETDEGKVKKFNAPAYLAVSGKKAHQVIFYPGHPKIIRDTAWVKDDFKSVIGKNCLNLSNPYPKAGSIQGSEPWVEHIRNLYPDNANHIFDWLAFTVQRPETKINHAIVLHGGQGIGKSLIFSVMGSALNGEYGMFKLEEAIDQFNDAVGGKKLLVLDEPESGINGKGKLANNRLKNLIAAPPHAITINGKYRTPYRTPNIVNLAITTNDINGLKVEQRDRRYYVCVNHDEEVRPPEYFRRLANCPPMAVYSWLMRRDISNFDSSEAPPGTIGTQMMMEATEDPNISLCASVLEELGNPEAVYAKQFNQVLHQRIFEDDLDPIDSKVIYKCILKLGYVRSKYRVRIVDDIKGYIYLKPTCTNPKDSAKELYT